MAAIKAAAEKGKMKEGKWRETGRACMYDGQGGEGREKSRETSTRTHTRKVKKKKPWGSKSRDKMHGKATHQCK